MLNEKKIVGKKAAEWVQDGMLLGLGTGSTAEHFIRALAHRIHTENLKIMAVSSSYSSSLLAHSLKIPITTFDQISSLDLYVDGADEVDSHCNLIKGRGAAMLQEKILARSSKLFLVIVDSSKLVSKLGSKCPIPIEILPQSLKFVTEQLKKTNGKPTLRMAEKKDGPVVTDQGNIVLDVHYNTNVDWLKLNHELNNIPGIMEHGLFLNINHEVLIGEQDSIKNFNNLTR